MSFKRKTENIAFSVSVTPDKKKKFETEDTRSVAVLAPFNPFPKVSFENIKLRSTAVREVYLVNPTGNALQVELTKLPDESRGYIWSDKEFDLAKESQKKLVISWTPTEYGSWHDNIKIINKKTKKPLSELKLSSATEEPPKVLKKSLTSRGALTKKSRYSSKQDVVKKLSSVKIKSENKENEPTFSFKTKKPTLSGVCIENENENIIIYESRKPLTNQTFTQINEENLDEKYCDNESEVRVQSVANSPLLQNSNRQQVRPSTSRQGTFDVVEPVTTSRRSTYSLRNRQITNVINVKEEINFELLVSPGVHNKSLELAASKLVCPNIKIEACSAVKAEKTTDVNSATFTVQPSSSYNVTGNPDPLTSVTFNKVDILAPAESTITQYQSPIINQLLSNQLKERFSLESAASSEKFYDSLEAKHSLESLDIDWDIYEIDKFSQRTSEKEACSFLTLDKKGDKSLKTVEPSQINNRILQFEETLSEFQASQNLPYRNITLRRKADKFPSPSPTNYERVSDSLENLTSPNDLNQTKDTLLQLDEDFGKFTLSIASSSPINHRNASCNNLNRTFTPGRNNPFTKDNLENNNGDIATSNTPVRNNPFDKVNLENYNEENAMSNIQEKAYCDHLIEEDSNLSKCPKNLNVNNTGQAEGTAEETEKYVMITEMNCFVEKVDVSSNGPQNALMEQKTGCEEEQLQHSSSKSNLHSAEQYAEFSSDTKHTELKWNISPPQNNKEEESVSKHITAYNFSKRELPTPVRFTKRTSTLSCLASNRYISQPKGHLPSQMNTNCNKSSELPNSDRKNETDSKNPIHSGGYAEEVFLMPPAKVTRRSLQKKSNGSPPKIRRLSQDIKVKRLSTPSMPRKLILNSTTEVRKQHNLEVLRSLPRSATLTKKRKSLKVADWVPAVRKLKLTSTSSQSEEELSPTSADLATPDPFLAATTLNPFARGGLYFNNKWLKEQEIELIQWADRMLRPPSELELDRDQTEHGTLHRLNALRATAFSILTSKKVATVLARVKAAVEKNIISIRSDRQLHADLGLQDKIISLLMSYNPLWLRLCLEAVYQCNIHLNRHSDRAGLREFIRRRVLDNEYLRQAHAHPTVPHLMLPQFEDEMKKFTVYKFLVIVYLLDLVKSKKVILHNPCLFNKDSKLKSSKDILIEFNKEFISGAGDITRILRQRGYEVTHCQTYIDEFDFSLTCTKDLRDGVRLTKLAENLVGDKTLCSKLRVPAVSILQKKFNADIAFSALKKAGYDLPLEVSPKDISDGHNEKTLSFLWHLRGIYQKRAVLIIITKWRETKQLRVDRKEFLKLKNSAIKIQKWYRRIKQAGTPTEEETRKGREARENFLKLKSIAVRLQKKFRKRKEERDLKRKWQAAAVILKWYRNCKRVSKDKQNYKAMKTATIVIQRAFRNYKSRKTGSALEERNYFIKIRAVTVMVQKRFRSVVLAKHERQNYLAIKTAAINIQRRFRANRLAKKQRNAFLAIKKSTIVIQRRFKAFLIAKQQRKDFCQKKAAAIIIQERFRAYKQGNCERNQFLNIKSATVKIQRKFRAYLIAKCLRKSFLEVKGAALVIQRKFRADREAKKCRERFCLIKKATVTLQRKFRAQLIAKDQRKKFLEKKRAAVLLQRRFRINQKVKYERKQFLALKAATVVIQRRFRANKLGKVQRDHFLTMKSAALKIQRRFREYITAKRQRNCFISKKAAAIVIQRRFRAHKQANYQRKLFMSLKTATIKIQRKFRNRQIAIQQRQHFLKLKCAAVVIQKTYRQYKMAKQQRTEFITMRAAVIKIQRRFKTFQLAKKERQNFLSIKTAALTVQRRFRANKKAKTERRSFLNMKNAAIIIQRRFKAFLLAKRLRQEFLTFKKYAVVIQRRFQANKLAKIQRKEFCSLKSASVTIQRRFRALLCAKHHRQVFLELKAATIKIQRKFRLVNEAKMLRKEFISKKSAAVIIQRRFRAYILAKRQRIAFLELKAATIKIQKRFRSIKEGKLLRIGFIDKKTATVRIQRRYRALQLAKRQRRYFLTIKSAAVVIQEKYRGYKLAKQQREEFLCIKTAVLIIQRRFRAYQLAKKQRQSFLSTKTAAIRVQRIFRSNRELKKQRKNFLKMKNAAILIQRRFRATLLRNTERNHFQSLRAAAVTVQRRFRANKQAKCQRNHFLIIKSAAVLIQTRFKAFMNSKQERQAFIRMKTAVLTIQRVFRAYKQTKSQREKFLALRDATIIIQRRLRAKLFARQQRQKYLSLRNAAVTIQRRFRAKKIAQDQRQNFIIFRSAAITIPRKFREKRRVRTVIEESFVNRRARAAIRIQAAWRGYLIRKTVTVPQPPKTKTAHFEMPSENHQPISTRGQRYFAVLSNHKKYSVAELQNTLFNIDKITVLSADQCEYYVRNGAVKILYEILVHQSNRAFGVQTCVELILSILLNLYRAPTTANLVWKESIEVNGIYHLFDLMMRFKTEKTSTVFCKACTVIWLFAQDSSKAEVIMNTPKVKDIYKYVIKSMKKSERPGPSGLKQERRKTEQSRLNVKKPVTGTRNKFPALRFNWGNYFDDLRAFDDKDFALSAIVDKLNPFL